MILDDKSVDKRLESPNNLMNRLKVIKDKKSPLPFSRTKDAEIVSVPSDKQKALAIPGIEDLIDNFESKVQFGKAHASALDLLVDSLHSLKCRLGDVKKPEQLTNIASSMTKILGQIKEHQKGKDGGDLVQINIYAPQYREITEYETITLTE